MGLEILIHFIIDGFGFFKTPLGLLRTNRAGNLVGRKDPLVSLVTIKF